MEVVLPVAPQENDMQSFGNELQKDRHIELSGQISRLASHLLKGWVFSAMPTLPPQIGGLI